MLGFSFFYILDAVYYPQYLGRLLTIRLIAIAYACCAFILLSKIPIKYLDADILAIPGNLAISLMCYFTEGFSSVYFGGNMLVILATSMLAVNLARYAISLVIILVFHFSLLILRKPLDLQGMSAHAFFLSYAAVIGFIIKLLADKIRNREFIANRKNEYFVKVFAHDIKNRIAAGITTLELHMENSNQKFLKTILNNEKQMNRMVVNLINIFSEERIVIKKEPMAPAALMDIFKKHWAVIFNAKNIEFICRADSNENVWLDKNYMLLAFDNLLSNASQHTPENGKTLVELSNDNCFSYISFLNSGKTIPKEAVKDIFKQYLHPKKQTAYHKGLGLNYSKMMCELHGGSMTYSVENNMNKFTIKMPLDKSSAA